MFVCISVMCLHVHVDLIQLWLPEIINVVVFGCNFCQDMLHTMLSAEMQE